MSDFCGGCLLCFLLLLEPALEFGERCLC